jgi:hypothetical protein
MRTVHSERITEKHHEEKQFWCLPHQPLVGRVAPQTDAEVGKRRELLEGKLLPFCETKGYDMLAHLDVRRDSVSDRQVGAASHARVSA